MIDTIEIFFAINPISNDAIIIKSFNDITLKLS